MYVSPYVAAACLARLVTYVSCHYFHHVCLLSCSITSTTCSYCPAPLLPPSVPTVLLITSTMCAYCSEETWENLGNLTGRTLMHFFLGTGTAFCFYDHFLSSVHCVVVARLCVLCVVPCPISSPVILAYLWVIAVPNVWTLVSKKHLVLNSKDADRQGQFSDGLDCCVCQLSAIFGASWALILVCFAS